MGNSPPAWRELTAYVMYSWWAEMVLFHLWNHNQATSGMGKQ